MSSEIPESHVDLLQKRAFASLGTLMADGGPHVTPVWLMYEAPYVVINSAKGRVKDRNLRRDPRVALAIRDPDNPYRYLGLQGRVVQISEGDGVDVIHRLSHKYTGQDYNIEPGATRVTYRIEVENAWTMG